MAGNSLVGIEGHLLKTLAIGYKDLKPSKEAGPLKAPGKLYTKLHAWQYGELKGLLN